MGIQERFLLILILITGSEGLIQESYPDPRTFPPRHCQWPAERFFRERDEKMKGISVYGEGKAVIRFLWGR
ncbi:hypothetical protein L1987_46382 [Smallanthus sonchifolius]|uniref:Uncharacterized protein n=1 Tax=Smallanthus sonchifolius TaxID=185202 RepID=A0ACB9G0J4_9ASTR|nr:hypothetical protein L1987_46382 [Smallanthus sonchifolius]